MSVPPERVGTVAATAALWCARMSARHGTAAPYAEARCLRRSARKAETLLGGYFSFGAFSGSLGVDIGAFAGALVTAVVGGRRDLRLYFPAAFAVGAAVLTLILCLLASIMPSVRAAWLPVPAALRNE